MKKTFKCYQLGCDEKFISWQKRDAHTAEAHKPPKRSEQRFLSVSSHRLLQGQNLNLGDRVGFNIEGVITKLTLTEGSNVAEVEVSYTKDTWMRIN